MLFRSFVLSFLGSPNNCSGGPCSKIFPSLKKHTLSEISLANPIFLFTFIIFNLFSLFISLITFNTSPTTSLSISYFLSSISIPFLLFSNSLSLSPLSSFPPPTLPSFFSFFSFPPPSSSAARFLPFFLSSSFPALYSSHSFFLSFSRSSVSLSLLHL